MSSELRLLIVDDMAMFRKIISNLAETINGVQVVGTAVNGQDALEKIPKLKPDVITLDVEMPILDGLSTLKILSKQYPQIKVIMVSTLTHSGAQVTIKALEMGAFDFVAKPAAGTINDNVLAIRTDLISKLNLMVTQKILRSTINRVSPQPRPAFKPVEISKPVGVKPVVNPIARPTALPTMKKKVVAIGVSTGGPNALSKIMPKFPKNMNAGIVIVQHMPPLFTKSLAERLNELSQIEVKEAQDGDEVRPGLALLAMGGRHMEIYRKDANDKQGPVLVRTTDAAPENSCRPSVDVLFRSVSKIYGGAVVGVIMTGMGFDGAKELKIMKDNGAYVIAQNEETCTVFGMPKRPIEEGYADAILPLDDIPAQIMKLV
ncbi:MAG: chemotaxis response regulator protein-glutamate methylesterase [Deltaproteobacteria bacterium]|nr:chemotaxis response regulator protein-glutamate methylesterase [Deltaproteobacteria bacterium]